MNNFNNQGNPWRNKWWEKTLIAFCAIAILGGVIGARNASLSEEKQQEQHQRQEQRTEREEPKTTPPPLLVEKNGHAALPEWESPGREPTDEEWFEGLKELGRIYDKVEIGMTEREVVNEASEPNIESETGKHSFNCERTYLSNSNHWRSSSRWPSVLCTSR